MKIYKKILLALFLFITFLCIKNNVFASFDFTSNNVDYILPNLPDYNHVKYNSYTILYDSSNNSYTLVFQPITGYTYFRLSDTSLVFYLNRTTEIPIIAYRYFVGNDFSWGSITVNQDQQGASFPRFNSTNNGQRYVVYSTVNIYIDNTSSLYYDINTQHIYEPAYIADTDEVLSNLDDFDDILIFPRKSSKIRFTVKVFYS